MKKFHIKHIPFFVFLVVVFCATLLNGKGLLKSAQVLARGEKSAQTVVRELPDTLKESFVHKTEFTDLYGITQNLLGKRVVGNFEFMKDEEGIMHLYNVVAQEDQESFVKELIALKSLCEQNNGKLLYLQMPPRITDDEQLVAGYRPNNENEVMEYLKEQCKDAGVEYYDYVSNIIESGLIKGDQVYFRTDAHMTTAAELILLEELVSYLEDQRGLEFPNKETILNWDNYSLDRREFLGNFSRSSGKYYSNVDTFDMYLPNFQTHLRTVDQYGQVIKDGDFKHAIMNGYEDEPNAGIYTYWVTNYGNFTRTAYQFENLNVPDGPNIILAVDSNGYRTASYLSLMCHSVTIVDPRFDLYGHTLSTLIKSQDYDAVIVSQGTSLCGYQLVYDENILQAEIVSHTTPTTVTHTDSYVIDITVKNTGTQTWSEANQNRLCIWQDGVDWGYRLYLPDGTEVKAGEEYTFTLEGFVLPEADSTVLEFQMLQEGILYFGEREGILISVDKN